MTNSKTPKIVVAVVLAAVYATGLAMVTKRNVPDSNVAQKAAVEPAAQLAAEYVPSAAIVPESADASTSVIEQPTARTEAPARVASTASKAAAATRESEPVEVNAPSMEPTLGNGQGVGSRATALPLERTDVDGPNPTGEVASVGNESDISAEDAPSSEQVDVLTEDGVED